MVRPRSAAVLVCLLLGAESFLRAEPGARDWPLHNLDVHNSRYSTLDEITVTNAGKLGVAWSFETARTEGLGAITPVVVDGVMYFNAGSKLFAVDAATGKSVWTFALATSFAGGRRGPAYGDGRIYAAGQRFIYAVDSKTG